MSFSPPGNFQKDTIPSIEEIEAQLKRLTASRCLKPSVRLCRFLEFVIERTCGGHGDEIKEYLIGTAVYGRPESFDPKQDSIVRVEASRLRTKLRDYYDDEGRSDPLIVELPKGAYTPVFRRREAAAVEEAAVGIPAAPVPEMKRSRRWVVVGAPLLALGIYGAHRATSNRPAAPKAEEFSAVAVMPFIDWGGEEAGGARRGLAAGLAEDLVIALGRDRALQVVNQTSRRGAIELNLADARRDWKVASLVEGSVRREGNRVRVNLLLVSTVDGYQLWSAAFERNSASDLDLQAELASTAGAEISAALARLAADASGAANEPEALGLFRQGTALLDWNYDHLLETSAGIAGRPQLPDLEAAVLYFEKAVRLNPKYARAYAALAQTYSSMPDEGSELRRKMRAAAEAALALDGKIASAHALLGYSNFLDAWDFAGAEREFRRAIDLQPRLLAVYRFYGDSACLMGNFAAGAEYLGQGVAIFAGSPVIATAHGVFLLHSRRFDELREAAGKFVRSHPDYPPAHWLLGLALQQHGEGETAAKAFAEAQRLAPGDTRSRIARLHLHATLGRRAETEAAIAEYQTAESQRRNRSYVIALLYSGLGEKDRAFENLERAFQQKDNSLPYLKLDPRFDGLRGDARYVRLMSQMKL